MKRLESLDIVRGLDMFLLTTLGPIVYSFFSAGDFACSTGVLRQFSHPSWTGFTLWDMIMPFFMFCAGAAVPFAITKYMEQDSPASGIFLRVAKRVVLLWILGMMCQGRLLSLDPQKIVYFSNTLQSIAVGYLAAVILFLYSGTRTQISVATFLLLLYWALMMFVRADGFGGGDFSPEHNLCEWVDRQVLGLHCDHASLDPDTGAVVFREKYNYTWVLSSLTFIVTVVLGMLAGKVMMSKRTERDKLRILLVAGVAMTAAGWLWNLQMPVIKHIWTSSMTLVAGGYSFLVMALFYWMVDIRHFKGLGWLKVYGMNAIVAYMCAEFFHLSNISKQLVYGLEQYLGEGWYGFAVALTDGLVLWVIMKVLHKHKIFIKV